MVTRDITKVKRRMKEAGLTQAAVADIAGVSRGHVNYVLNGRRESGHITSLIEDLIAGKPVESSGNRKR